MPSLVLGLVAATGCQEVKGPVAESGAPVTSGTAPVNSTTPPVTRCTCHCLASWIGPLAAADVSDPGYPKTSFLGGTWTDAGIEYWNANVNTKTYACATKVVTATSSGVFGLAHNRYTVTRTRSFNLVTFSWGPWGASKRTTGAILSNAAALGSASPALLPQCTDVGLACP